MAVSAAPKSKENPGSTERTKFLYGRCRWKHVSGGEYVRPEVQVGNERLRLYTEAHKASVGDPEIIRRAKCLAHFLDNCSIYIQDEELIVGDHCEKPDILCLYPEMGFFPTIDLVESDAMSDENRDEARELTEYWKPFGLQDKCSPYFSKHEMDISMPWAIIETPPYVAAYMNVAPPYMSILEDGLEKRIAWCEEEIEKAFAKLRSYPWNGEENLPLLDKIDVWRSMIISGKAIVRWARRYSRLAKAVAENFDVTPKRKKELLEIADICWRVPAEPAKGLRDAMQSKWFCYEICHSMERYASGYAHLGDRILWPYYKASVIDKTVQPMTREEAVELCELERLKVCERGIAKGRVYREGQPGANDLHIITLGGLDENGNDACTDYTDVILEASLNIRTPEPSLAFRYSPKINEKTRRLVFENIAQGFGFPSIKHDEKAIKHLIEYFKIPPDEAAHWALVLCMAPGVNKRRGTQKTRTEGGGCIDLAKCMELAMSDGFDHSLTKLQMGPKTGDPVNFKSIDDVFKALEKQVENAVTLHFRSRDVTRRAEIKYCESPFLALMDDICVEEGLGAFENKKYPNTWSNPLGIVDATDSLAALKKLVFDDKKYTMEQFVQALRANWQGFEEMRRDCIAVSKWGNDDDYVDDIGKKVYHMVADKYYDQTQYSGMHPVGVPQTVSLFSTRSPRVGALPYGRRHGEVLADGGCSPYLGMDKKGPTAVIKTMSKIPQDRYKAIQLNQRLPVSIMRSEKGFEIWTSYMKAWHDANIDHVQFNVVDTKDMLEAQKDPEKWEDMIVRIAGYSARFINLPRSAQDAIIARTEQQFN
ncbi:MAG: pyruvate formate-lyase [Peptococcaceae bacterium BRH_c4a]|nr:MAG: pyruvate formate-lyase [Peptococcaceae bacterium BRH_c4a]